MRTTGAIIYIDTHYYEGWNNKFHTIYDRDMYYIVMILGLSFKHFIMIVINLLLRPKRTWIPL